MHICLKHLLHPILFARMSSFNVGPSCFAVALGSPGMCCRWGKANEEWLYQVRAQAHLGQQHPKADGCRNEQDPAITVGVSPKCSLSTLGQSSCLCLTLIWGAEGAIFPLESNTSHFPCQPNSNFEPFSLPPVFQTFADRENPELIFQAFWVLDYTLSQSFLCQQCWNWHGELILLYLFTQSERKIHESQLPARAKFRFIQLELIIIFI